MNLLRRIAAIAALAAPLALATGASAQGTGTITGQVTDAANGRPLAGVQMVVQGTNIGSLTNENGRYVITRVPLGAQTVRAVIIGYSQTTVDVTVTAGQPAVADFQLAASAVNLEALVVSAATGRSQRLREVGTKVGTIEVEKLNPAPITSVADVLGGRTEGVIMQDVNGTTGTSQRIRIRGANSISLSNEPLIFVDGVQINSDVGGGLGVGGQEPNRLNDINPNDIANIEIIKGPAASAQYGTAAANGVILITTKRGAPGATQWDFFAEAGELEDRTDYPGNFSAYQINDAGQPLFLQDGSFNSAGYSFCPNRLAATGSCSQDGQLFFNTLTDDRTRMFSKGDRQRLGGSVRGGNEMVRYFVSGQWEDEEGVIFYNTQEKVNFRANLDAALRDNLDLSLSVGYTDSQLGLNNNDNSIFSPIIQGLTGESFFLPANPDIEGVNPRNYGFGFNLNQLAEDVVNQDVDRFVLSSTARFRPTSWLSINANAGMDLANLHDFETVQPGKLPISVFWENGFRSSQRTTSTNYTGILSGVGTFQFTDDLVSTTTVGTQYNDENSTNTFCQGSSIVPNTFSCGTTSDLLSVDEDFFRVRTLGIFASQEFAWRDRIFVGGSLRGDKTSTFGGANADFAYFPSVSGSWVLSEEEFFPEIPFLSTFRVRSAWGQAGLRPGFRQAVTLFSPTTVALDGEDLPGVVLSVTGNELLEQETTSEFEVGFDAALFSERLSADFTYFRRTSEDALISRPLPPSLGLTGSTFQNLGEIRNSGTELSLRLDVVQTDNFGLNLGFNNTTIDNEINKLGEGIEPIIFNRGLQRHDEGLSAGTFVQQEVTYNDADGNGLLSLDEISIGDDVEIGPSIPEWQRSVFADIRFLDFITVSTLFEGRGGHFTGNDSEAFRCGFRSTRGCAAVGDPNASLRQQAAYLADRFGTPATGTSAFLFVEEADFWRWRELSVTLDVPRTLSNRVPQLDGLRLTLAGRNLATFTDYTGLDPETVEGGGNANFSQSEFNTQPPVRYFMLRLDYNF
ncbi:MAG: SusC/RagA family TonB-linked outer membrane protein [Longimicrobiales bacterium]|nr:SusC/RagA family TonB-linked outer membrane protein [Longimicrobiales bacterium]